MKVQAVELKYALRNTVRECCVMCSFSRVCHQEKEHPNAEQYNEE